MKIYVDGQNTRTHSVICVYKPTKFKKKQMKVIPYNSDILKVEFEALKWGIEIALTVYKDDTQGVTIITDRQDIANEFNGEGYRENMLRYEAEMQKYISLVEGKNIKVVWQPRELNKAGIALEKRLKTLNAVTNRIISGVAIKKRRRR